MGKIYVFIYFTYYLVPDIYCLYSSSFLDFFSCCSDEDEDSVASPFLVVSLGVVVVSSFPDFVTKHAMSRVLCGLALCSLCTAFVPRHNAPLRRAPLRAVNIKRISPPAPVSEIIKEREERQREDLYTYEEHRFR